MKKETLVLESSIVVPVKKRDTTLTVKLGWDAKSGTPKEKIKGVVEGMVLGISDNSYDLNLAAVVEYDGGKKPELVFHGQRSRADSTGSIVLKKDSRTVIGAGSDETMVIHLGKIPEDVRRVILFMNIAGAHSADKNLYDVQNVFVQIEDEESCKVLYREEEAFTNEYAKDYCSYTFAELWNEKSGWMLRGASRYSCEDNELDTLDALIKQS